MEPSIDEVIAVVRSKWPDSPFVTVRTGWVREHGMLNYAVEYEVDGVGLYLTAPTLRELKDKVQNG